MEQAAKIHVAGHRGLVGSAIARALRAQGYTNLLERTHKELDLTNGPAVQAAYEAERPAYVFLAAAKVGGILANDTYPVDFLRDNLLIQTNIFDSAHRTGVKKVIFFGSSCIYPKLAPQPIKEDYLLTGPLEPTNDAYAIAKIAGIKAAQAYRKQFGMSAISLMPTNLYGPGDNFDLTSSHVLPALIRKFHEARVEGRGAVTLWGTGTPRREFLHVDDLAEAALKLAREYDRPEIVNVGTGEDITIRELAETVARVVGFEGRLEFDPSKPDGTPRKLLDVSRIHALGWRARIELEEGIRSTYQWYLANCVHGAGGAKAAEKVP